MTFPTTKTIEEITETLIDYRGKTPHKTHDGVKLITAKVIKDGFVLDSNHEYIAEDDYDSWMRRGLPKQWDILITTEAPLGELAQLRTRERIALAQRVILLRGNPSLIDQQYYFQALKSPFAQGEFAARATGTTVLGIKQSELRRVRIPYFSLAIQKKIASILSAYDDSIENNTRRLQILEGMACLIYDEWFVKFQLPGCKKTRITDSDGLLGPREWERTSVEQICASIDDGDWIETKDQGGSSYRLLQISNVGLNSFVETDNYRFVSDETFRRLRCKEVVPGHILVARMPTPIGRAWMVTPQPWKMITAVDVAILATDKSRAYPIYLLYFLNSDQTLAAFAAKASGTTRARITRRQIATTPILLPPLELQKLFAKIAEPINKLVAALYGANANLRRTRDLLLPKLISGEIDIEKLDVKVPAENSAAAATAAATTV